MTMNNTGWPLLSNGQADPRTDACKLCKSSAEPEGMVAFRQVSCNVRGFLLR